MIKKLIVSITKSKYLKNSGWLMAQRIYTMLMSFVVGALSARYLGPANYGLIGYGASYVSLFTAIANLGLSNVIIYECLNNKERTNEYFGTALMLRFVASLISVGAISVLTYMSEPDNTALRIVTALQSIAVVANAYDVLNQWFIMNLCSKHTVLGNVIAITATSVWRIVLLATNASVFWFACSTSVQAITCGVVVLFLFIKRSKLRLKFTSSAAKELLAKSYHYILSGLMVTIYSHFDRIMIGKILDETHVGFYTAAATIAITWEFVPNALIESGRPLILAAYAKNDIALFERRTEKLIIAVLGLGFFVSIGYTVLGKVLMLITYGEEYLPASTTLIILTWASSLGLIGNIRGPWQLAQGLQKYSKYILLIGSLLNVVLNLALIPLFGVEGAALATLVSSFVTTFFVPLLFKDLRHYKRIMINTFKLIPEYFMKVAKIVKGRK